MTHPKPLTCHMDGGKGHAQFDSDELKRFVENTDAHSFIVQDEHGNCAPIQIEPIRNFFANVDTNPI